MEYRGKQLLQDGYRIPPFQEYVKKRIEELKAPIPVPVYAASEEAKWIAEMQKHTIAHPYQSPQVFQKGAKDLTGMQQVSPIDAVSDPTLYQAALDSCRALGLKRPSLMYYKAQEGQEYNAYALGFIDMTWIFVSRDLREGERFDDLEISFIVGHELGHFACCHMACKQVCEISPRQDRMMEYSADRAGLIAAAYRAWTTRGHSEDCVALGAEAAARALRKIALLNENKKSTGFDAQMLTESAQRMDVPQKHAAANDTHPSLADRIYNVEEFANSAMLRRCLRAAGVDVEVKGTEDDWLNRKLDEREPKEAGK